jgi:hypothetical protein
MPRHHRASALRWRASTADASRSRRRRWERLTRCVVRVYARVCVCVCTSFADAVCMIARSGTRGCCSASRRAHCVWQAARAATGVTGCCASMCVPVDNMHSLQGLQFSAADCATKLTASRLMVRNAARMLDERMPGASVRNVVGACVPCMCSIKCWCACVRCTQQWRSV